MSVHGKLSEFIRAKIAEIERKMLEGTCGGGETIEGQMSNYRSAVMFRKSLYSLENELAELAKTGDEGENSDTLQPMEDDKE